MRATESQAERILDYLRTHDGITPLVALELFGCFRLAARVSDLKADGYPIVTETYVTPTRKRVAVYRLVGSQQVGFGL